MKKLLTGVILALTVGTLLFANGDRDTAVTVEGKLVVTKTVPTIVSGDKTWVLPAGPFYQLAWENGIKAGDTIKAEGVAMENRNGPGSDLGTPFMPTKVWVNGKLLDLSTVNRAGMNGPGMAAQGNGNGPSDDSSRDNGPRSKLGSGNR